MQRFCGVDLRALVTEDALCTVFPFAGFLVGLYVHRTDPQAFAAIDALILVAVDAQQGEVAHGHAGADDVGLDLVAIGFRFSHIQTFLLFFWCALWYNGFVKS